MTSNGHRADLGVPATSRSARIGGGGGDLSVCSTDSVRGSHISFLIATAPPHVTGVVYTLYSLVLIIYHVILMNIFFTFSMNIYVRR